MRRLYEVKKSSKSKSGAKFVATITAFGEAVRQKGFLRIHPSQLKESFSQVYFYYCDLLANTPKRYLKSSLKYV